MGSLWISPNYEEEPVSGLDLRIASLAWGFTLGFSFLTAVKAGRQTATIWKRAHRVTTYVILIWGEMLVSTIFGFICWFFIDHFFQPSFAFFFSILTLWALQVQFLLQIIINRIALLITNKKKVLYMKWGTAALITAINISVYCIWIPARLQTSKEYIEINKVWDRCEKAIYLLVDGLLNAYFLYLVKNKLMARGMAKYRPLFRFNAFIVLVSLSMDVLIIAMMSMKNTFVYMQFHPVAYIVKLNIEMSMAELITKVAQAPNQHVVGPGSSGPHTSSGDPGSTGVSRSWYNKGGKDHKRLSSQGRNNLAGQVGPGKLDSSRGDGVTSPDPNKNYSAWVSGGSRTHHRDVESGRRYPHGTHFEEDEDDIGDAPHETHEMGFLDFVKNGNRSRTEENVIVKTMETIVSTKDIDESGSVTPSTTNTVIVGPSRGTSETGSTNELKPSR
ncbi:hypothetical protein LTR84_007439 [Exophiala bonariae]|uniref:Transmembrane protein n=1 Tax=Exophiala bonariae TaxID=1690606 RepID=A0AAV9N1J3_9EURO|nr:hypothetical protein LTR84_007439 [Exophiala bonariae]